MKKPQKPQKSVRRAVRTSVTRKPAAPTVETNEIPVNPVVTQLEQQVADLSREVSFQQSLNTTLKSELANSQLWLHANADAEHREYAARIVEKTNNDERIRELRSVMTQQLRSLDFVGKLLVETNARMEILAKPISAVTQDKDGLPVKMDVVTNLESGSRSITLTVPLADPPQSMMDATDAAQDASWR